MYSKNGKMRLSLFLSGKVCRPCAVSFINKAAIYYWIIFPRE